MTVPPEVRCAYAAGIVDGDGYVGIKRRLPSKGNRMTAAKYSAAVNVAMTDIAPVEFLADMVDARSRIYSRNRGAYKTIYVLDLEHEKAARLLRLVRPYLIVKLDAANAALRLNTLRKHSLWFRNKNVSTATWQEGRAAGHEYTLKGQSDEYLATCEALYQQCLVGQARSGNKGFSAHPSRGRTLAEIAA